MRHVICVTVVNAKGFHLVSGASPDGIHESEYVTVGIRNEIAIKIQTRTAGFAKHHVPGGGGC